jgi:chromosome segregation ATPase
MTLYKTKREELKDLQGELANSERSLMAVTSEENSKMQSIQVLEIKLGSVKKDIVEQEAKRKRAKLSFSKLVKELGKRFDSPEALEASDEGVDCKLRETKDKINVLLTEISKVAETHPELKGHFAGLLVSVFYAFLIIVWNRGTDKTDFPSRFAFFDG